MDYTVLLYILAAILIVIGVAGVILPALPGLPLVFGGMLLAAWADGFERISTLTLVILGVLTVLSLGIDFAATAMGAKRVGASRYAAPTFHHLVPVRTVGDVYRQRRRSAGHGYRRYQTCGDECSARSSGHAGTQPLQHSQLRRLLRLDDRQRQ